MRTKKRKIILSIILIGIVISVLVLSVITLGRYKKLDTYSDKIIENLSTGICDLDNNTDYPNEVNSLELPDEIKNEMIEKYVTEENPLMYAVLTNSEINSNISIFNNQVEITISAPDMMTFVEDYTGELSSKKILEDVKAYCPNADRKDFSFVITYEKSGDEWTAQYDERIVANAVTGGLADAYDKYANEWLDEEIESMED